MNRAEDTRQYFDRTAVRFSANYRDSASFEERQCVWDRCIELSMGSLAHGVVCLDIGCGDGSLSRPIAARGHPTVGIDQSTSMLSLATQRAQADGMLENVEYIEGTMPFSNGVVDRFRGRAGLILCSSVLEYVEDYAAALRQFDAMLASGGRIIVSVPNRQSVYRGFERLIRWLLPSRDSYLRYQRHQFRADMFKAQLVELGLNIVHEEYFALPLQTITARVFGRYRGKRLATLYLVVAEKLPARVGTFVPSTMTA